MAGEPGFELALEELALAGGPAAMFAAACLAFHADSASRFERIFAVAQLDAEHRRAVVSASGFESAGSVQARLWLWAQSPDAALCAIGLGGLCIARTARVELIEASLESDDTDVRVRAARGAAEHGFTRLVPHLRTLLHDSEPRVRYACAWTLARFREADTLVVKTLLAAIREPKGHADEAAAALALLSPRQTDPWFHEFTADPMTVRQALTIAETSGNGSLVSSVLEMAQNPNVFIASKIAHLDPDEYAYARMCFYKDPRWGYRDIKWDVVSVCYREAPYSFIALGERGGVMTYAPGLPNHEEFITDVETHGSLSQIRSIENTLYVCGMQGQVYRRGPDAWEHIDQGTLDPNTSVDALHLTALTGHPAPSLRRRARRPHPALRRTQMD